MVKRLKKVKKGDNYEKEVKMAKKIVWSQRADKNFDKIIE